MVQCFSFVGGPFQMFARNSGPESLVGDLQLKLNLQCVVIKCFYASGTSYAMTVWKSQGKTLGKTVVDIGPKETAGLTFVAL
jgi:hypothetical protein